MLLTKVKLKLKRIAAQSINQLRWQSLLFLAGSLFLLSSGLVFFLLHRPTSLINDNHPINQLKATVTPVRVKNEAILLLGYGGGTHEGGKLTDTMIEVYIQPSKQTISFISIPRDLWVKLPVNDINHQPISQKINFAYALGADDEHFTTKPAQYRGQYGGLNLAKDVVGQLTGIEPDFALAINFHGFLKLLNTIGPIKVDVPYSFTDNFYPIEGKEKASCGKSEVAIQQLTRQYHGFALEKQFPCRYEKIQFKKGVTTMNAETALKFVRSRHGSGAKGDFGRSQRQEALLLALKNKLLQPTMLLQLPQLVTQALKLVDSDITPQAIFSYSRLLNNQSLTQLNHWRFQTIVLDNSNVFVDGKAANGAYILQPRHSTVIAPIKKTNPPSSSSSANIKQNQSLGHWLIVKQFIQTQLKQFDQATTSAILTPTLLATSSAQQVIKQP